MPPLQEISGNSRRGYEMTPYERGKMSAFKEAGLSTCEIARKLERPRNTIRTSLTIEGRQYGHSLPRKGGP